METIMMYQPKILAFSGSLRRESYNNKLVKVAAQGAEEGGAKVTYISLRDYPLPIYDQEMEDSEGLPQNALILKKMMLEHDGFLLACPEYNSSMSAAFKNVIDWTSRNSTSDETTLSCYRDKVISLMSASIGPLGGMRGLVHVRSMFSNMFSIVLPKQKCISKAGEAFDESNNLKNASDQKAVLGVGQDLAKFLMKHKN
jgi:chromate reductase, NAD(P)H dehydrogenase (quinone)